MHGWQTNQQVDGAEEAVAEPDWSVRYTRIAGYAVYGVTVLACLMMGAVQGDAVQMLGLFAMVWSMSLFCALDARAHRVVFVQSFWRLSSIGWPISILVHLVRVRGKRGALTFALHGALLAFCALTSVLIGSVLKR